MSNYDQFFKDMTTNPIETFAETFGITERQAIMRLLDMLAERTGAEPYRDDSGNPRWTDEHFELIQSHSGKNLIEAMEDLAENHRDQFVAALDAKREAEEAQARLDAFVRGPKGLVDVVSWVTGLVDPGGNREGVCAWLLTELAKPRGSSSVTTDLIEHFGDEHDGVLATHAWLLNEVLNAPEARTCFPRMARMLTPVPAATPHLPDSLSRMH